MPNKKISTTLRYLDGTIRVSYSTLELLQFPNYIILLINVEEQKIIYAPSIKNDRSALKVKYSDVIEHKDKIFNSTKFVRRVFNLTKWDRVYRYNIPGEFIENENIIVFNLNDAFKVERIKND